MQRSYGHGARLCRSMRLEGAKVALFPAAVRDLFVDAEVLEAKFSLSREGLPSGGIMYAWSDEGSEDRCQRHHVTW